VRVVQVQVQSDKPSRWVLPAWLGLLAVAVLINYVDRGNLAVAAPLLKGELNLSTTQVGVLITAFFWTYTLVMAVSGWIVDRFDVNWVLVAGFAIWSVATAATGIVYGFGLFLLVRMLLGVGESVAFPSFTKIICLNVPQQRRGIANAVVISGMSLGPAVGTYACGMSMAKFGWRPVFVFIGVVSLLWIVPWLKFKPESSVPPKRATSSVPVREMLRQRNLWAASFGHLCSNYPFYFMIVWLPLYLVRERHLTMQQMAVKATLFYLAFAATAPVAGHIADVCVRAGRDVSTVRKTCMGMGHALSAIGVLMAASANEHVWLSGLIVMGMGGGFVGPNIYIFAQTLAGPPAAGRWIGIQNSFSNLAGVIVGPLTGWIVDRSGHFGAGFAICAVAAVMGGAFWVLGVTRVEQTQWVERPRLDQAAEQAA
jgi:MFS transporter, ACS family, D-galactonate transporter